MAEVNLEKHLQRKHKEFAQATFQDGQILFRCKLCSKSFESKLALHSHQYVKHYCKCHLCESSYTERMDLQFIQFEVTESMRFQWLGLDAKYANWRLRKWWKSESI